MSATLASFLADLEAKAHAAQETVAGRLNADRVIEFHQACSPEIIAALVKMARAALIQMEAFPDEALGNLHDARRHLEAVIKERT